MYLTGLRLSNIACFDHLSIDFSGTSKNGRAPWVVLIGENGTGKSTILQMIAAALIGDIQISTIAGNVDWHGYKSSWALPTDPARISVSAGSEPRDSNHDSSPTGAIIYILRDAGFKSESPHQDSHGLPLHLSTSQKLLEVTRSDNLTGGWFACGYSPWRRMTHSTAEIGGAIPTLSVSKKAFRFASVFGDGSGLTNVPDWLSGLYFKSIHPDSSDVDRRNFETARSALRRILPRITSLEVTSDRQVILTEGNNRVLLERLSDGYRGVAAWAGDLIRRLFEAYPDSPDPLSERGVVLVDEIDLHLHPAWQRSIVQDCRRIFPNLQFIVTAHSPFIAQDLRPQDRIIVLERSGSDGRVKARIDSGAVHEWTANQILSAYFGLSDGTRGKSANRSARRIEALIDKDAVGNLSDSEQAELIDLSKRLENFPLGDSAVEMAAMRVADAAIASLRKRRLALESVSRNGAPYAAAEQEIDRSEVQRD